MRALGPRGLVFLVMHDPGMRTHALCVRCFHGTPARFWSHSLHHVGFSFLFFRGRFLRALRV